MPNTQLSYVLMPRQAATAKKTILSYCLSANLGQQLQPLAKIASGGELSRFALALQVIQNTTQCRTCVGI